MNIISLAVIVGALMGATSILLIVMQHSNGSEQQVSDEWLRTNIYDRGKTGL